MYAIPIRFHRNCPYNRFDTSGQSLQGLDDMLLSARTVYIHIPISAELPHPISHPEICG